MIDLSKNVLKDLESEKKKLLIVPNATPFKRTMNSRRTNRFATGWFRYYFQTKPLLGYINYPQHNR